MIGAFSYLTASMKKYLTIQHLVLT